MFYNLTIYVSFFFNILYVLLIFRTFAIPYLKQWYNENSAKKEQASYDEKEQELIKKGNRPFFYEHGRVKVFAESQEQADARYREMKTKLKKAAR